MRILLFWILLPWALLAVEDPTLSSRPPTQVRAEHFEISRDGGSRSLDLVLDSTIRHQLRVDYRLLSTTPGQVSIDGWTVEPGSGTEARLRTWLSLAATGSPEPGIAYVVARLDERAKLRAEAAKAGPLTPSGATAIARAQVVDLFGDHLVDMLGHANPQPLRVDDEGPCFVVVYERPATAALPAAHMPIRINKESRKVVGMIGFTDPPPPVAPAKSPPAPPTPTPVGKESSRN